VSKIKEDPIQPMLEPVMSGSSLLEEVEYIFEGRQGFCNVCKLELSSVEHASEHLNSFLEFSTTQVLICMLFGC
jgi:hypothetical protein